MPQTPDTSDAADPQALIDPVDLRFAAPPATEANLTFGADASAPQPPAHPVDLVFSEPPAVNANLVFGRSDEPPPAGETVDVSLSATLPALSAAILIGSRVDASVSAALPPLSAAVALRASVPATLSVQLPPLAAAGVLAYDTQTQRPIVGRVPSAWQTADARTSGAAPRHQDAAREPIGWSAAWTTGDIFVAGIRHRLPPVLIAAPRDVAGSFQDAQRAGASTYFRHQDAERLRLDLLAAFDGAVRQHASVEFRHQDADRTPRARRRARWQNAAGLQLPRADSYQPAAAQPVGWHARHQDAMRPPPGIHLPPALPPAIERCYTPSPHLLFATPWSASADLVFVCERSGSVEPPQPPGAIVIARRRSYVVINSIEVRRADTGQLLPALDSGFSMRLDWRSWTWGFALSFHASALSLLQPAESGDPAELEITVNGQPFRMLVESLRRSVRFPRAVVDASGRGKAALLDAPYAPAQTFDQPDMISAQQLMQDVLTVNNVSLGWSVDWQLTDWTIPAGTWSHQGTWISALADIAAAAGGYVQPHDTAQTLRILPAWPARSWQMASATPDLELPAGVATVEEVAWAQKPDYDALYMQGTPGTKLFYRKRAGTPGDNPAPMAVHALLIDAAAADQRAIADLSDTGRQVEQTLQLMLLPEAGIIKPGTLLRYTDDAAATRTGIVRSIEVRQAGPRIDQTLTVQAPA